MSQISFLDNVSQNKYYNFFSALYKRNKKLLIVSTAIFVISIFIGYIFSGSIDPFVTKAMSTLKGKFSKQGISTVSIFLNNIYSASVIYIGGLFLGIITFISLFSNGLILGYLANKIPPVAFIILIAPHGIFEIPALILAGAAGFRLTSMVINIIKSLLNKKPVSENYWEFKDSLALFAIAAVLFFIAAIIEANITFSLVDYAKSFI